MADAKRLTLGLDMGTNSIGWAVLTHAKDGEPSGVAACGSRIFLEAVDAKTKVPKNQQRREARGARKLTKRRKMRKDAVTGLLLRAGLLPLDATERSDIFNTQDPYVLRKRGLDELLKPFELGRAVYHLSQRRGFLSNRKKKAEDDGKVKTAISALRVDITNAGCRTLGEYLASQPVKRKRYTDRAMYKEEFDRIMTAQKAHLSDILTTPFRVELHNAVFYQRPLKKHLVGKCTFEPERSRAASATLEAQAVRFLQDINHLTLKNPITHEYRKLEPDELHKLKNILEYKEKLTWAGAKKALGLHKNEVFNLEENEIKKDLTGNRTAHAIIKAIGERWKEMKDTERNNLVTDMLTIDNVAGFLKRMKTHWGFDEATAVKLAETELEKGYARLSVRAMRRILPHLEAGMIYSDACAAAGYDHANPNKAATTGTLPEPGNLRNPVVQKALYEARKVVNGVIREYGMPDVIRVEMARDMKTTMKEKKRIQKEQNERKKKNEAARFRLSAEWGIENPSGDDVDKYNMWEECKQTCPYTGESISREALFSANVDVEHIIPYSRSLDDSYMNKTLCMAAENRNVKKNMTPYEAYHADETRWQEINQRIQALPYPKRMRFEQKEVDTNECVSRQLNDTRYISKEVAAYLKQLGTEVEVTKGQATAALRHRWGLNRVLAPPGEAIKNREDHRHHAIDAVVIALTSRRLFSKLSRLSARYGGASISERGFALENPWPTFFSDVCEKIDGMVVSHASARKISGALHAGTAMGYLEGREVFAYRKPLDTFNKEKQLEDIGDRKIREIVKARLDEHSGDFKAAFGNLKEKPLLHLD
ncbi:MAG: type II CRISPR RNA-guided endonuclease Cas9, partial [Deltaproteobacteria bacterium]|nr:type II CRISPR RNA-guided endonuclease Cas9 [Deltaproteobacteria bacterium]